MTTSLRSEKIQPALSLAGQRGPGLKAGGGSGDEENMNL